MRKRTVIAAAAAVALTCRFCAAQTSYAVYQIFDIQGLSDYTIMDKEEHAKLAAQIREEEKIFPSVMVEAKKMWDENQTSVMNKANKAAKLPFPGNKIKPRAIKKFSTDFSDLDLAKKQLAQAKSHAENNPAGNKGAAKKQNPKPEDIARENLQARSFIEAASMVNKLMGDKLGRPIPKYGFTTPEDPNKK